MLVSIVLQHLIIILYLYLMRVLFFYVELPNETIFNLEISIHKRNYQTPTELNSPKKKGNSLFD
jgi:hypothetical protein